MKYKEAQAELQKVFDHQQTVSVPKLKRLFQSLNISVKKPSGNSNTEISFLKGEISKLKKENKRLKGMNS
ncbi:hypothetical protein [Priestia aryabhattai]|uniref:hypothetical protein n=1 Tax=Priestia aryabhattai TaxID=412384 RepID=UPI002E24DA27|nr:hypothetical protein [Priestia aryabhattai]MED4257714.1 hypothetical protein [Priestia aryabhattai]